tara:strand:+ start:85543 stop:88077 length:2535 start_codon:yes stop_codon:yes gene_type:complete
MLKNKIQDYFQRYSHLRILFFFDEDEEYREEIEQLDLGNIRIAEYNNNAFRLKWQLADEWKKEKVFLYVPSPQPATQKELQDFPLLGLLVANKALQLDDVGSFMEEYGLQRHQKSLVSKYMKELKYAGVQEVCKPILSPGNFHETRLQQALVSAFLKFKKIESWGMITAKLLLLSDPAEAKEWNRVVKKIQGVDLEPEVCQHLKKVIGIPIKSLSQEHVRTLAQSTFYNTVTQGLELDSSKDPYASLKVKDSAQITHLNQMLHEVSRSTLQPAFQALMESLGNDIKGQKLIEVYGQETEFSEYTSDMIWAILVQMAPLIKESPSRFIKRMERISLQDHIKESIRQCMSYVVQVAKVHRSIKEHDQYILDRPEEYIQEYIKDGYKVDSSYRRAISAYKQLDLIEAPALLNIEKIHQELNSVYETHTDQINREWLKCLAQFQFDYRSIKEPKQYDFYETEIAPVDQKVVVIISDALRYEAAQELLSEMHGDTRNTAEMRYMLASIPSKTNVGMCQLLPGNKQFNSGDPTANDKSSSGTDNRNTILGLANEDSRAIQFSELEGLSREKQREIFKAQVVYVYHDVIDAMGDKRSSERRTFDAVKDAIDELKKFVKNLHAALNASKVLITADHGFLYNDREIQEKEKESIPVQDSIQSHNRFVLSSEKQDLDLGYSFPLSATTSFEEKVWVNIPYSVNRYKKQGVGHQFVHGGGSLQEVIIPLIESSRKRVDITKKVTPMLINADKLKVVSNILKVNILQESEVSRLEKERSIKVGLYVDNELVSNQETLLLNFTSESPSERMVRCDLVVSPNATKESIFKLKIYDEEDLLNPIIEELVQNSTLIQTDF